MIVLRETREGRPWTFAARYPGLGRRTGWVPAQALGQKAAHRSRYRHQPGAHTTACTGGRPHDLQDARRGGSRGLADAGRENMDFRLSELVPAARNGLYGVLAFGLSAYSPYRTDWAGGGQVGIHGTNQPHLIPG